MPSSPIQASRSVDGSEKRDADPFTDHRLLTRTKGDGGAEKRGLASVDKLKEHHEGSGLDVAGSGNIYRRSFGPHGGGCPKEFTLIDGECVQKGGI